jgi:hypothetical protein
LDLEFLLYGLIAISLGLIPIVEESRLSKEEKQNRNFGYSEASYLFGGYGLLIAGIIMIIMALFYK